MNKYGVLTQWALALIFFCGVAAAQAAPAELKLPAGTAIPITFPHTLDASNLKVGDAIVTRTDQVIFAPDGARIPRGSQLAGTVVEAGQSGLAIRFETLTSRGRTYHVHVALRALASFVLSLDSHSPAADYGSLDWDLYRQVGGNYFFPYQTVYSNDWTEVGKSTRDGVFVKLERVEITKSRDRVVCDSTDAVQSVGVFASNACGVYGFDGLTVEAAGTDASGAIRFLTRKRTVKIPRDSSALLLVVAPSN